MMTSLHVNNLGGLSCDQRIKEVDADGRTVPSFVAAPDSPLVDKRRPEVTTAWVPDEIRTLRLFALRPTVAARWGTASSRMLSFNGLE